MATSLLKFCMVGSDGLDLALGAGAAGFEFAAGVGNMYTGSGLFWGGAVALGSKFMGFRRRISFGVPPLFPFHCPPQSTRQ